MKNSDIFSIHNNNTLGKNLSDLRNELAHVGRPKKLIKILNISDYVDVAEMLKLVVVSHLLEQIGVARDVIYEYQKRLLPKTHS